MVACAIQNQREKLIYNLERGLGYLGSIGSTAPFIGLFGTVVAMKETLSMIGASNGNFSDISSSLGEALAMTALGLIVAIPAVLGFNFLLKLNPIFKNS